MNHPHQTRRDNLRQLTDQHGGVVALAQAIGCDPSQISRWLAWPAPHSRAIRSQSAARIESALQLPAGWLSLPHTATLPHHPLIDAACQYLTTSPDPALADIIARLLQALTPPRP